MRQFLYKIFFILSLGFLLPQMIFAAQIFFESETTQTQVGGKIEVNLFVNTEQENINAFEGKMLFPSDILDLKEIRDGNTIVNFWIEKPKSQNGAIIFSGITPGGLNGARGLILSAIFEAKRDGVGVIEIQEMRVLKNDGAGTPADIKISNFQFQISKQISISQTSKLEINDTESPESFIPEIARDQTLLEGKWFVVFATQDKASGIDHYEIKESRQKILSVFQQWVTAESPYILNDQELRGSVFVKAVDKSGNERIVKITPRNPLAWYANYENWIMIIIGLSISAFVTRKLWRKSI